MAYVALCADMKQEAVAQVLSIESTHSTAIILEGPITCTIYSAQLLLYTALVIPSKSCVQNMTILRMGTDKISDN